MPGCAVAMCKNTNKKTKGTAIKYYGFPKNDDLAKQWINACHRQDAINIKNARICSIHFNEDSFEISMRHRLLNYNPKNSRNLKSDAMPVLHLPHLSEKAKDTGQFKRFSRRSQRSYVTELLEDSETEPQSSICHQAHEEHILVEVVDDQPNTANLETVGGCDVNDNSEVNELKNKIRILERQNEELSQQVKSVEESTAQKYENALATVFTPGQIKKLMNSEKGKKFRWKPEDIAAASSLWRVSPKAYKYLRANNYPLPALSSLRK